MCLTPSLAVVTWSFASNRLLRGLRAYIRSTPEPGGGTLLTFFHKEMQLAVRRRYVHPPTSMPCCVASTVLTTELRVMLSAWQVHGRSKDGDASVRGSERQVAWLSCTIARSHDARWCLGVVVLPRAATKSSPTSSGARQTQAGAARGTGRPTERSWCVTHPSAEWGWRSSPVCRIGAAALPRVPPAAPGLSSAKRLAAG